MAKKKSKRKTPKGAGTSTYNNALDPKVVATIWLLSEEGHSQRSIATQLNISPSTVGTQLAKDPVAYQSVRARLMEARSAAVKGVETTGWSETIAWLKVAGKFRQYIEDGAPTQGKKAKGWSKRKLEALALAPRFINAVRQAASAATGTVQLLTGQATARLEGNIVGDVNADAESLITAAIEAGVVDILPPSLKAVAQQRMADQPEGKT